MDDYDDYLASIEDFDNTYGIDWGEVESLDEQERREESEHGRE